MEVKVQEHKTKYNMRKAKPNRTDLLLIFICITGLMLAGMVASLIGGSTQGYDDAIRPPFALPSIAFAAIFNALFTILGISISMVYKFRPVNDRLTHRKFISLILFGIQLAFVITWPLMFFRLGIHLLALSWTVVIFGLSIAYMVNNMSFNKASGWLMIPYLIWLAYLCYISLMFIF
ncbi:MAG: tryptophan-rich sensory protein [Firmicutes bacterium]|nr:tryptophan-rich sensory protein [Bacillota bacterium]